MTPPPSPDLATRLHAVTAQIRDMAGKATAGPWEWSWIDRSERNPEETYSVHQPSRLIHLAATSRLQQGWHDAAFIASMSPDIAILIADVVDAVAEEHIAIHWPHDEDHEYVCARCGLDSPCPDLTRWTPLVEAFEAQR